MKRLEVLNNTKYLVYTSEVGELPDDFALGMLENNKINGVSGYNLEFRDNIYYYKFRLDGTSLTEFFSNEVTVAEVVGVFRSIARVLGEVDSFMLDLNRCVLDSDYVMYDADSGGIRIAYVPAINGSYDFCASSLEGMLKLVKLSASENADELERLRITLTGHYDFTAAKLLDMLDVFELTAPPSPQPEQSAPITPPSPQLEQPVPITPPSPQLEQPVPITPPSPPNTVTSALELPDFLYETNHTDFSEDYNLSLAATAAEYNTSIFDTARMPELVPEPETEISVKLPPLPEAVSYTAMAANLSGTDKNSGVSYYEAADNTVNENTASDKVNAPPTDGTAKISSVKRTYEPTSDIPEPKKKKSGLFGGIFGKNSPVKTVKPAKNIADVPAAEQASLPKSNVFAAAEYGGGDEATLFFDNKAVFPRLEGRRYGTDIIIAVTPITIGNGKTVGQFSIRSGAVIDNPMVSRLHAVISRQDGTYFITDTNSRNHTRLNGDILEPNKAYALKDEDKLTFADAEFTFRT